MPQYVATVERIFEPIGVASINSTFETPSASIERAEAGNAAPPMDERNAGTSVSNTIVVFPEPDTPVTTVSRPRGTSTDNGCTVCTVFVSK